MVKATRVKLCLVGGTIGVIIALLLKPEWMWVPLPFALTGLAELFDTI